MGKFIKSVFWAMVGFFGLAIGMTFIPLSIVTFAVGGIAALLGGGVVIPDSKNKGGKTTQDIFTTNWSFCCWINHFLVSCTMWVAFYWIQKNLCSFSWLS